MIARRVISALIFLVAALAFAGPFVVLDTADSSWGQKHTTISISGLNLILGTAPSITTEGDERSGDSSIPGLAEAAANAPTSPATLTDGSAARVWAVVALLLTLGAAALAAFRTNRLTGALSAILAVPAAVAAGVAATEVIDTVEETRAASDLFPGTETGPAVWLVGMILAAGAFFVFLDAMVTGHRPRAFVPTNMQQGYPQGGYPQPGPPQGYAPQPPFPQQMPPQPYPQQQPYPPQQPYPQQPYPPQGYPPQQGHPPQGYPQQPPQPPYGAPYGS